MISSSVKETWTMNDIEGSKHITQTLIQFISLPFESVKTMPQCTLPFSIGDKDTQHLKGDQVASQDCQSVDVKSCCQ